ncbi:MAG: hypothetical protein R2939_15900 [Kofleriaceae bacterium]
MTNPAAARRAYAAGHFELAIDGGTASAFVKSVEGGFVKTSVVTEAIGPENLQIKHATSIEVEPISTEIGLSGCRDVMLWIQDSWKKRASRRSGVIAHADFDHQIQFGHAFSDALILETAFPALDASSNTPGYLKLKFLPERVETKRAGGGRLAGVQDPRQKLWIPAAFRLIVDGHDLSGVSKIDGFAIKQGVKPMYIGRERLPELVPTKIEFPDLAVTMALQYAEEIHAWYTAAVVQGVAGIAERSGAIEFLSPSRGEVIFRINLFEVGIKTFQIVKSEAKSDKIKQCRFELFVGRMELDQISTAM